MYIYKKKSHAKTEKHVHAINELQLTKTISLAVDLVKK